jgi:NAD(P)-dependent dehydrogenase (short-subunit alcohol dehydrogenase family)
MLDVTQLFSLRGRTAIVTGAASGLGKTIALHLLAAGVRVAVFDQQDSTLLHEEAQGDDSALLTLSVDVTQKAQVDAAVSQTHARFGQIDLLVNCAGITRRMPGEDFVEEDWDRVIDVNLKGTFITCQAVGRVMLAQGNGSIINFASLGALVAIPNSAAYCASKGGVMQLTRTLAVEWATRGVRVNAIVPGVFMTPLLQQCLDKEAEYGPRMLAKIPMGRFGQPEEIVGPVFFLASKAASHVTGHLLTVDGGYLAL